MDPNEEILRDFIAAWSRLDDFDQATCTRAMTG
ncbi:MAG: hypothetical protein RIS35_117 [Pseudomonadota bacterium]|jgi:hypothetical protein